MKRGVKSRLTRFRTSSFLGGKVNVVLTVTAIVISLALLTGYTYWPLSPVRLVQGDNMAMSGLYASWKKGEVMVLIRHGERCDRSSNDCLGAKDGITGLGSSVSTDVGRSFSELGLAQTDVITSPLTRTAQTAQFMFGHPVEAQEWLYNCDETMLDKVLAHKSANRNLILVTHSGCIGQLESLHGYPHAATSEYDSALFISLDSQGRPVIRGILNPEDWKQLAQQNNH
ncbi:histidine phosphatase family protein [Pseudomonas syringae]|uniref:lipopolysaccharide core heptose(II)-phosphate phosphatase PmrG n=1 Tax=Pseudomonas syringae TaxID=317 RepID=UPI00215AD675|nr:histidine phosphatase family protein [Pseudomonas syringae]MCR8717650.1 histidine phosphatase family protein [Pseudomonas syringae]